MTGSVGKRGRPRRVSNLVVALSPAEMAAVKTAAGDRPVAPFIREYLLTHFAPPAKG
jgi:hypothetical protein